MDDGDGRGSDDLLALATALEATTASIATAIPDALGSAGPRELAEAVARARRASLSCASAFKSLVEMRYPLAC